MARTITRETKREGQRKAKRQIAWKNQKKERVLILLLVEIISPIAPLMLPTCKSWNLIIIGGLEQASPTNAIFISMAKGKAH